MSVSNVAASVRQRLLNRARERGEDYQVLLTRYALERFLYRISQSARREQFVLKGAYAFVVWHGESHRMTRDLDLLGFGTPRIEVLAEVFRDICKVDVVNDGVVFDAESVAIRLIRDQAEYDGVRAKLTAHVDTARLPLQVDVGFGDVVTPKPLETTFPSLLGFPAPLIRAYPRESVVAEKLHSIVLLGMANSRMKDYYDIWYLCQHFAFEGALLSEAISATFERRGFMIPEQRPLGLSERFASDTQKQQQWNAFLRNVREEHRDISLVDIVRVVGAFLLPLLDALRSGESVAHHWSPGGPWK